VSILAGPSAGDAPTALPALPDIRDAYGVALADYDGDGDIDVYLVGFRTLNRLLINTGNGRFHDASIVSGAGGNLMPMGNTNLELGAGAADFDNDGDVDLVIAGWGDALEVLRNRGDGTFVSVTEEIGVQRNADANMALFSDMNGDGWLDLLLTNETGSMRLYRNDRGIRFHELDLESAGLPPDSGSQGGVFTDFDGDGKADLAIAGWHHPARIFKRDGDFHFRSVDLPGTWPEGSRCNAALQGDVDQDGDMDILFTVRGGKPLLFLNQSNPPLTVDHPEHWQRPSQDLVFTRCDSTCGFNDSLDAYGGALFDADGDGDLDLYLTGRQREHYYENLGGRFSSRSPSALGWPKTGSLYSTGFATADLTPAPGLDAVIATRDTACLLVSGPTPKLPAARITLHGVASNPQGMGSQISLWLRRPGAGEESWSLVALRDLPGGQGYLSSYLGPLDLFLPDAKGEYRVRVDFPSGKAVTRRVDDVPGGIAIWEYGLLGALVIHIPRVAGLWLGDFDHLKRILAVLVLALAVFFLFRALIRITARGIARRDYTKTVESKNRELESLLEQLHKTQHQLIQHEKLASLGQLVAGIAHELNNPIGFIYANLHQVSRYLTALPKEALDERARRNLAKVDEALKESQEGALRVRDIVQNLRGLSRAGNQAASAMPTKIPCDLAALMDKAVNVAKTGFSAGISIEKIYAPLPPVAVDPGQMQQVFLNLLVNAGQAMGETGILSITIGPGNPGVEIAVRDNGRGIAPENLAKVFDPFFTTKDIGQGLGLGLHLAYSIVKAHGGELSVQSDPGAGAVFTLRLPPPEAP